MSVNTIKFSKHSQHPTIYINDVEYRGYKVSNLPSKFGCKYIDTSEGIEEGISSWFNYKGLTYIEKPKSFWDDVAANNRKADIELLFRAMK
jgi:hypothetical protein